MRFCIVTPFFPSTEKSKGGVGTHYYDLAVSLAPLCEKIIIIYVAEKEMDESVRRTLPENVTVTHVADNFGLISGNHTSPITKARKRINRLILNLKIALMIMRIDRTENLVALETTNYYYLCLAYSFLPNRKPLITRFSSTTGQLRHYGNWRTSKVDLIEQLEIWMFKRSTVKLTHTHAHGKLIADQLNLPQKEILIIPHGTSIQGDKEVTAPENMDRKLSFLFLGRLETRKGIQTLLASLPELVKSYPRIHFRIAGEDEDGVYRKWFADKHPELAANVKFLGEISEQDKVAEYQACDVFVAPSLYESFGLIYIEAMRFGKPVIACRSGGVPEVVADGVVGLLIEPGSVAELSKAMITLIENPELRKKMGRAALHHVEKYFTAEKMASNSYRALSKIRNDWSGTI